jgi:transcriptional regulator with XRE-family HTH domain
MGDTNSESQEKRWFPARIRALRLAANKRQADVATAIGVKESTYANAESSNTRRLRLDRVHKLARWYGLGHVETAELVTGWEAMPESDYNKRNARPWAERDERRSKLKAHDKMKLSLLEILTLYIAREDEPCTCPPYDVFADKQATPCEICHALKLLGVDGWGKKDLVMAKLADIQEEMVKS